MKVKVIRDTVAGKRSVFVGEVLDLPEQEARELILMKKVDLYVEPAAPAQEAEAPIETADLQPAGMETSVKRVKRKE